MKICLVCDKKALETFMQPIDYWACSNCHTVFVKGKDNTISMLDKYIEYNPNYVKTINVLMELSKTTESKSLSGIFWCSFILSIIIIFLFGDYFWNK